MRKSHMPIKTAGRFKVVPEQPIFLNQETNNMKDKVVKMMYEVFEWDNKGEYNLIDMFDNHDDVLKHTNSDKNLRVAYWEVYESGKKRLMMCDAYSLIKRFGDLEN